MWSKHQWGRSEQRIEESVQRYMRLGELAEVSHAALTADAEQLLHDTSDEPVRSPVRERTFLLVGWLYLCRAAAVARHQGLPDLPTTVMMVGLLHDAVPGSLPPQLWQLAVEFGADLDSRVEAARYVLDRAWSTGADPTNGIAALQHVLPELPIDHPYLAAYHGLLGSAWSQRFDRSCDPADLDNAVGCARKALSLCPADDSRRIGFLYILGDLLAKRLNQEEAAENIRACIEISRKFLDIAPSGNEWRGSVLMNLGVALSFRFDHSKSTADLDEAVQVLRQAAASHGQGSRTQVNSLRNLAIVLYQRYHQTCTRSDLDEAITALKAALNHVPESDSVREVLMRILFDMLIKQASNRTGHGFTSTQDSALTPHSRAEQARHLIDQARNTGDDLDRDHGIELLGSALQELPADFLDRAPYSWYLGVALFRRFRKGEDPADLDGAEEMIRQAVRLCPAGDTNLVQFLVSLGEVADARHRRADTLVHIEASIDVYQRLLALISLDSPVRQLALHNLGLGLKYRFHHTSSLSDLDQAVDMLRQAHEAMDPSDPDYGPSLVNLGNALILREEHTDASHDLDEAVRSFETALPYFSQGDAVGVVVRSALEDALRKQAARREWRECHVIPVLRSLKFVSGPSDRPTVIPEKARQDLTEVGRTEVFRYSNILAELLQQFDRTGDNSALESAADTGRRVLVGMPPDHPDRPFFLGMLGRVLLRRFERLGDHRDLDAAVEHLRRIAYGPSSVVQWLRTELNMPDATIEQLRQVTGTQIDGFLELSRFSSEIDLSNLAHALLRRFERDGDSGDLDEAVNAARRAAEAVPVDHQVRRADQLNTLGSMLVRRFQHTGNRVDLDRAIEVGRQVLGVTSTSSSTREIALNNLCNRMRHRFDLTGDLSDIDDAVGFGREVVNLAAIGHASRSTNQFNLALALWSRSRHTGDRADLDAAIDHTRASLDGESPFFPGRAARLLALAKMLRDRGEGNSAMSNVDDLTSLLREAADAATSPPQVRMEAAVFLSELLAEYATKDVDNWEAAAESFAAAVGLLPLTAWRGLAQSDRERLLAPRSNVATDAAACAISCGRPEWAVELLDQGRSVMWGQALDIRTDLTVLRAAHPKLAARLDEVRAELDRPSVGSDRQREHAEQQRRLAREWEHLLDEVRHCPGFERFLLPMPFADLADAAAGGPVIVINVSRYRCDALVLSPDGVRSIPLTSLTAEEAQHRAERYLAALQRLGRRKVLPGPAQQTMLATLEWLWDTVASPVLDSDGLSALRGRRVWWCATGPLTLLPIHAAGYHDPDDAREHATVLGRVVSSYTPTLRSLVLARRSVTTPDAHRRLLVVACGDRPQYAPTLDPLPGVHEEAESLKRRFPQRHTARIDTAATREQVLSLLGTHACAHLACHAGQDLANPSQGALYLYDEPLRITDIARLDLDRAELAILSACQTAIGGTDLPNEAIHLSAALLFVGYRQIVSTMWTISDESAKQITDEVYQALSDHDGRIDPSRTANALHDAVNRMRAREPFRPILWASYVHLGR